MNAPLTALRARRDARTPGKRAEAKAHNRRVILDAARRVFAERGYHLATVRDVIRATPLAPGTFYKYFRSKEEVLRALRDATAETICPILREARLAAESPEAFFIGAFGIFFEYAAEHPEKFASIRRRHALHLPAEADEIIACFVELREDIEHAVARGVLPVVDAEDLAAAMQGAAFELAEAMLKRERPDPKLATNFATRLFMSGLVREPAPQR